MMLLRPVLAPCVVLTLVVALLATDLHGASPGKEDTLLAVEVPHIEWSGDQELCVVGRFQDLVGTNLSLVGCPRPFQLAADSDWPVLRSADLHDQLLAIDARPIPGEADRLEAVAVAAGPTAEEIFRARMAVLSDLDLDRRMAIAGWAIEQARQQDEATLLKRGRTALLDILRKALTSAAPDTQSTRWLEHGQSVLEDDPRWGEVVMDYGNRHQDSAELALVLRRLGYDFASGRWRPRAELLAEIGMVLREQQVDDEKVKVAMTRERALLENAIELKGIEQSTELMLRGLTTEQYQRHAENHDVVEGMKRGEVVRAWGYPGHVTWFRRKQRLFEVWIYPRGEACLADGQVFHVRDEERP